jgi:hypothetical protein
VALSLSIFHYVGGPKGDGRTPKTEEHLQNNNNTANNGRHRCQSRQVDSVAPAHEKNAGKMTQYTCFYNIACKTREAAPPAQRKHTSNPSNPE